MQRRRLALVGSMLLLVVSLSALLLGSRAAQAAATPPFVGVDDAWVVEPAAGATVDAVFVVRLTRPAVGGETVHYSTRTGTAGSTDFTPSGGTVTFAAGQDRQSVAVPVLGDDRPEPNETFGLTLSAPVGLVVEDATATGTIASDEGPRTAAVGDVAVLEGPAGTTRNAVFPVRLSAPVAPGETVSVHYATSDGTATAGSDYTARSGTLTFPSGASSAGIAVVVRGDATVEPTERFTLTLSSPVGVVLADASATGVLRNDDGSTAAAPAVGMSVDNAWVVEGAAGQTRSAVFRVRLATPATRAVSATYGTRTGSAGTADFTPTSGTVTVPAGGDSATVAVPVTGDDLGEGNETFTLVLANPVGVVLADATGLATIVDGEGPLTVAVDDVAQPEGSTAGTLSFPVRLNRAVADGQTVTFRYATSDGTATAGTDYTAASGTVTVPPGADVAQIPVPVLGDAVAEADESFSVTLSSLTGATGADTSGIGTLLDDDTATTPVRADLLGSSAYEHDAGATVTVAFDRPLPADTALTWSTTGGTATPGVDYLPQTDVRTSVPAGATAAALTVPLVDDAVAEPIETVTVAVTLPPGIESSGPPATVAILDDDGPAPTATARVIASGDIACAPTDPSFNGGLGTSKACRQQATSDVAVAAAPDAVLGLGDLQYEAGELSNFRSSYDLSWGRLKAVTHPAPGNHEYYSSGAPGYYGYFVAADGGTVDPWYAFDLGDWRVVALNSNCASVGGCGTGSPQETWLRTELADHPRRCTLAFWHEPRFSSGTHGDEPAFDAFWRDLTAAGADVVLNGHDHSYERFAPMTAAGQPSPAGIREFVSGLGGRDITGFPNPVRATSEVRSAAGFGVLGLQLRPDGYDWQFLPVAGATAPRDAGTGACH